MLRFTALLPALLILFLAGCQSQPPLLTDYTAEPLPPANSTPSPPPTTATSMQGAAIPYPPLSTPTLAPYQPPEIGSPVPTRTPQQFTQTPTFAATLALPIAFTPPARLPEGAAIQIFEVGRPIEPGGYGYDNILSILKEKSFFYQEDLAYGNAKWIAAINQALAPIHYQVKQSTERYAFSLYQGEKLLLGGVRIASRVSANQSQTDFVLFVEKLPMGGYFMVRKDALVQLPLNKTGFGDKQYNDKAWPQFSGEVLMYPRMEYDSSTGLTVVNVYRNDQVIYHVKVDHRSSHARPPLYAFWTYHDSKGDQGTAARHDRSPL